MRDFTRIVILLDRSGSMQTCRESTIAGINKFIREQKDLPGEASLKFVQFDKDGAEPSIDTVFDKNIKDVKELTQDDFVPREWTPLYDAQGTVIDQLGDELRNLKESQRPNKVIFVTITDGLNNASKEHTAESIRKIVEHQKTKYNWDFVYIGANQDAVQVGSTIGVQFAKSMTYDAQNLQAVGATYSNLSNYVTRGRNASTTQDFANNAFQEQERSSSLTGDLTGTTK